MEEIKNVIAQGGHLVQQAVNTVVDAIRGGDNEDTTKDNVCLFNKIYI
jgi:hypothetical protein